MSNSGPNIRIGLLAEYKEVFGSEPSEISVYLTGISRNSILKAGTFFLGFKTQKSIYHDFRKLIEMFFRKENAAFAAAVQSALEKLEERTNSEVVVINPVASLKLFQFAFENLTEEETQTEAEAECNIFRAYLALTQRNTEKEAIAFASGKTASTDLQLAAIFLAQSYPYSDIINYDEAELFVGQFVKAVLLFQYLRDTEKTKPLYQAFINYYECPSWNEYLQKLLPIVTGVLIKEREAHVDLVVRNDANFETNCKFIDKLIVEDGEVLEGYDFKKLRERPLYKIIPGTYRIIFSFFVVEKLFKGLYFKLAEINKTVEPAVARIGDLHGVYSDEFSEKTLLYKILNYIYQNRYIEFNGQQIKDSGLDAEPDYYIRNGNSVFLFESKDFLIRADIKTSYDYVQLEEAFRKKLFADPQPKAVLQLMRNIKRLLKKEFPIDKAYREGNIFIYPIVVLHDHQYDVVGLNKIVNDWFSSELSKLAAEGLKVSRIQPIVLLNMDTLIFNMDLFRDRVLRMEVLIDEYLKFIRLDKKRKYRDQEHLNSYMKRTLIPFGEFVRDYVSSRKMQRIPKMLRELGFTLFEGL